MDDFRDVGDARRLAPRIRRRGFTLIELLVVIAIIAILAAILFPVFARARENARRSSCASNLKQMGLAVIMYTQDYDEYFPKCWDAGDYNISTGAWSGVTNMAPDGIWWDGGGTTYAPGHYVFWGQLLFPYTKSAQLVDCPNGLKEWQSVDASTAWRAKYGQSGYRIHYWGQYGSNTYLINSLSGSGGSGTTVGNTAGFPTQKMTKVQSPSNIYMLMDWSGYYADAGSAVGPYNAFSWSSYPRAVYMPGAGKYISSSYTSSYGAGYWPITPGTNGENIVGDYQSGRHLGGINIVYADGHVKWNNASKVLMEAKKAVTSPVQPNSWTHTSEYNG